ncbi:MAG: hypothetical protein EOP89_03840, partial [Lysobacteraceae bacterium]
MLFIASFCSVVIAVPTGAASSPPEALLNEAKSIMLLDPARAKTMARAVQLSSQSIAGQRRRALVAAAAERIEAECSLRLDDFVTAEQQISKSIKTLDQIGGSSMLRAEALLTRGGVNAGTGRIASALGDYQAAFNGFRQIGDYRSQAIALSLIATLYNDARDNASALRYLTQARDLARSDRRLAVVIANNRGNALQDLGLHKEAEQVFATAVELADQLGSMFLRAQIMANMAGNRVAAGDLTGAAFTIRTAMPLTKNGEAAPWRPSLQAVAAEVALRQHRLAQAGRLIEQSFANVDLTKTTITSRRAHETAYRTFMALHRPAEALAHLIALKRLDDEATKLATSTSTALMGARFDFANQELRIARLRAEELRRGIAVEQENARFARLLFL